MNTQKKHIMKNKKTLLFLSVSICLFFVLFKCKTEIKENPTLLDESKKWAGGYTPPAIRTYPSKKETINSWIGVLADSKIRAHAWDIWESINTKSPDGLPIWETWFSGYEVFAANDMLESRNLIHDFENPAQFFHVGHIPIRKSERPTSFNRFSPSLARSIDKKRFNYKSVLDSINNNFINNNTPIVNREINTSDDSTDQFSFALKPVFQFISGSKPSAIPYWAGISTQTTKSLTNPSPDTWLQCVVVDPTEKLKPGTLVKMSCNGEPPKPWPVVALSKFYHIKITAAEANAFSDFAKTSGDDVGNLNRGDSISVAEMVKAGNIALLMAMHVTGKEIVNWTWQTFWWSPDNANPVFGADRPATIQSPWNNYSMRTAYYMVSPANAKTKGEPNVQFNPYLETNLFGKVLDKSISNDSIAWYGVFSNCMSCHRMAASPNNQYIPAGYIDASSPSLFKDVTKTDFLWSIPTRASNK
jgi:hypothetical protein